MKQTIGAILVVITLAVSSSGCSVFMAANQPSKKNLDELSIGTLSNIVLAELGAPLSTQNLTNGTLKDLFCIKQGYSKINKTSRAFVHGVMDI